MSATAAPSAEARSARSDTTASAFSFGLARTPFLEALQRVTTAIPSRTTLPVLNMVVIETRKGELALRCTDLDRTVDTTVPAVLTGQGRVALPAKRLLEIVSSLPNSVTVQVAVDDRRARLTAGRSKFDVVGMSLDDYPNISVESIKGWVTAAAPAFCDALSRIGKQAASAMSRPQFSSVLLEVMQDGTYLVGSDGNGRIARLAIDVEPGKPGLSGRFMIPRAAVGAVTKLFAASEQLTMSGTKQQMRISDFAGTSMIIRLTEGEYAGYAHILGLQRSAFVVLSRDDLLAAVKRVSTVTDRGRVELTFGASELTLTAKSEDQGTAEDVIGCAFVAGNWERTRPAADGGAPKTETGRIGAPFEVGFNPDLLNDACDVIRAEQLRLDFTMAFGPIYVRDAAAPDAPTVVCVMPLRAEGTGSSTGGSK